ncbi:hypothetical protein L6255_03060 [Candidatus Parcubacteria bacterium]|nr:hypothetical protein [Patescibacteria group bacterium]MCG2689393.1 hypothetical protein [Candidatus Parcubacteria bacterium]
MEGVPAQNLSEIGQVSPVNTEPKAPNNKVIIIVLAVFIFILLSVIAAGALYFVVLKGNNPNQVASVPSSANTPTMPTQVAPQPTPTAQPQTPLQTVGTNMTGIQATLTSVSTSGGITTVRFDFVGTSDDLVGDVVSPYSIDTKYYRDPLREGHTPFSEAYLVDASSSMRFDVVKDANGNYLAGNILGGRLRKDQRLSSYVQFTAPPLGSTVTINIPGVQPFVGVVIN